MKWVRGHLRDIAAVGFLFALAVACTWRISLSGRVLAGGDIFTYFYPYWAEATRAIRAPRLPLWNPWLFMGVPFVANSQIGFFYPLNWPLWLLLPAHRSVHVTIVLHLCLAALAAYLWGRRSLSLGSIASWSVGVTFALGGYLGAQVEHVNQLQGLAWLPLMLMLSDCITRPSRPRSLLSQEAVRVERRKASLSGRLRASCALAVVIALVLLAGHTQTAFISLFGVAAYGLVPALWRFLRGADRRPVVSGAALLGVGVMLGAALASAQLLPTWELSRLSVRAQGLPFNERVSFSLSPIYAGRALLPAFGRSIPPQHLEHVAYVGIAGLALAMLGLLTGLHSRSERKGHRPASYASYYLILLGLFFALGLYNPLYVILARYVPGFAHFRVPARWLALYSSGVAAMVGRGVEALWKRQAPNRRQILVVAGLLVLLAAWAGGSMWLDARRFSKDDLDLLSVVGWLAALLVSVGLLWMALRRARLATVLLLALLTGELFLASKTLPQTRATAPQAFTSVRPAVAHLLAWDRMDPWHQGRFLSLSDTTFDPGDLSLIRTIFGPQLSDDQLYHYIVATKQKEVLSPNLPLAFGVAAIDGYDGGLLPLQRYVKLQQLLLSAEDVSIDGRLRENLTVIPDGKWLSLFNVRYVITDKLRDAWVDDVFYDLQFTTRLSQGERATVGEMPSFQATALGLVSHLEEGAALLDGAPVGVVKLGFDNGDVLSFVLHAREDVPSGTPDQRAGSSMATRLQWSEARRPLTATVEAIAPEAAWVVRGISLIDERTGGFQPLVLSDRGRFRLVHSGDVKIYENLDVLPRAFIVPHAQFSGDEEATRKAMQDPAFDPSSQVVLSDGSPLCRHPDPHSVTADISRPAHATIVAYQPERVVIDTASDDPGYLVLTDAYYPGWRVIVDGERAPICRADVLFRAVRLEPGEHRVVFTYRPRLQRLGIVISLLGLVMIVIIWHEQRIVESGARCYNRMQP